MKFLAYGAVGSIVWFVVLVMVVASVFKAIISLTTIIMMLVAVGIPVYGLLRNHFHWQIGLKDCLELYTNREKKGSGKAWLIIVCGMALVVSDTGTMGYLIGCVLRTLGWSICLYVIWEGVRLVKKELPSVKDLFVNAW